MAFGVVQRRVIVGQAERSLSARTSARNGVCCEVRCWIASAPLCAFFYHPILARPKGLEPLTGGLETRCSIRLSYERVRSDSRSLTPVQASGAGIFSIADRVVKPLWRLRAAGANLARKSRKTLGSVRRGGDVV